VAGTPVDHRRPEPLERWVKRQLARSAEGLLAAISTPVVKERPFFGQRIVAKRGSVVASPVPASWDPEPDYFFHWFRDAAAVMDALLVARRHELIGGEAVRHFGDFVRFSLELDALDGAGLVENPAWRDAVEPEYRQYLRPPEELGAVVGDAIRADTRVNPDGTIDITRWARPQYDGSAAVALMLMRWLEAPVDLPWDLREEARLLLGRELDFTLRNAGEACFDLWEEEEAEHFYTQRLQAAALASGSGHARDEARRRAWSERALTLHRGLERFATEEAGPVRSRLLTGGGASPKDPDIAVVLAALHAGDDSPAFSPRDRRIQATLAAIRALFAKEYPINQARPDDAPALGRYRGDAYFGGNPWYVATLAGAELDCRVATLTGDPAAAARADAGLETVRRFTPPSGDLSEQFDRETGAPVSARHLAWSYAGFITAACARTRSR
jgi:glucoamylase